MKWRGIERSSSLTFAVSVAVKQGHYITASDMEAHIKEGGAWVVIHGDVYDVQSVATIVPYGAETLMENVGRDATEAFELAGHSDVTKEKIKQCIVGEFREVSKLQRF